MSPLERFNTPATVVAEPRVTPPAPFIVRLLTLPLNREAGKVSADVLVKASVALALLASITPLVRAMELPAYVSILPPTVNVPSVSVKLPPNVKALPRVTVPVEVRLMVKFCKTLVVPGVVWSKRIVPNAPVPNIEIEDAELPRIKPLPEIVEATVALPKVKEKPFKLSMSVELVSVMALPPFGPSTNRLVSIRIEPEALFDTI